MRGHVEIGRMVTAGVVLTIVGSAAILSGVGGLTTARAAGRGITIYVATDGSNSNPGTSRARPVATLARSGWSLVGSGPSGGGSNEGGSNGGR